MKFKIYILFLILTSWIFGMSRCTLSDKAVTVPPADAPFKNLSDYHFFTGTMADLQPNERVLPYDLNNALFSDYAQKSRFIWMPEGRSANYREGLVLDFPVGTVLIKNFFYYHDEQQPSSGKRILETRLLIKGEEKWEAHTYQWDERQRDAELDIVGDIVAVDWLDLEGEKRHVNYIIPNKNQCKGCHSYQQKIEPIGPKVRNLNKDFHYPEGNKNQLAKWVEMDYLKGYQAGQEAPKAMAWDQAEGELHQRAMAYLDINCGHCHNPHGPGGTTGLNLVYDAPSDLNLGINKPPVAAGRASGGFNYSIVKGDPDHSIIPYRMRSTETGVMMPELGRTLQHKEGLQLIREWISAMQ